MATGETGFDDVSFDLISGPRRPFRLPSRWGSVWVAAASLMQAPAR